MNLDEMKRLKKEKGYSNEQISESSGVPLGTVKKVFSGETKYPRYETLQALEKFFGSPYAPNYPGPVYDFYPGQPPVLVKDAEEWDYRLFDDGIYTADDLDRLRGDSVWGELIDGVLFNMASPSIPHQMVQNRLATLLTNYVDKNSGSCIPLTAPADIYIEKNDKTVLQPDVFVVCDKSLLRDTKVWGAPDFVIEILSPSTAERDLVYKLPKYRGFGVREYWIVDLEKERVIVYDFSQENIISIYTFEDKIPVGIWDGDLEMDFKAIKEEIDSIK
ncbi:MAG: Uma2 family endonuclease [Bacillota bacterium]